MTLMKKHPSLTRRCHKPKPAESKIAREGPPNGNNANTPQSMSIEQNIRAIGNKVVERQLDRPPLRVGREDLAIGLPRLGQGVRPQMNAVLLTIAEYVDFYPAPGASIDDPAPRREIEGDLNKTAIVLEVDVATHTDSGPACDRVADHSPFRDPTHDLVGKELPAAPYCSKGRLAA